MERMLNQLLNCGWSEIDTDPVQLRRVRTVSATASLLILLSVPFLLRAYEWHISLRMITIPTATLLAALALLVLGLLKNFNFSTQLVTLALYIAGAGAVLTGGGIGASVVGWWLLVPLLAGLLRGLGSGLSWGAMVLASIYGCYWAQIHGYPFPDMTPKEYVVTQQLMQSLGVTCAILILLSSYLSQIGASERKLAERNQILSEQVRRAEKAEQELGQAVEAKTRFLANMSHEMKTPLNSILGFSQRLQRHSKEKLDLREQQALDAVLVHSGNMLALVNDLLALSQLDAAATSTTVRNPLDLRELLLRVFHELNALASQYDLVLVLEADESMIIEANGEQIRQVVRSLVCHGLMYASHGKIRITLGELPQGALIQVLYPGTLSEQDKVRLFDRYNHLHSQNAREVGQSGLALALAREYVDRHGGRIGVNSDPGASNVCFNLFLPN